MSELMLRVLGPCTADRIGGSQESGGESVSLSAVQRRILCRLALARPGSAALEEVAAAIWADDVPATGRTAIHNQISRIRTKLGPDAIATDGGRYSLAWRTDAEAVSDLLLRAEDALARERFSDVTALAASGLQYWRGDPYADLDDVVAAVFARRRLNEARRSLETLQLEGALGRRRTAWTVPEAERLVAETPDDERRWILLIRALELAGRRGDALGAYERARRSLAQRLGLDPSDELKAAEASVLSPDGAKPSSAPSPFVGRGALIEEALVQARGTGAVLLVGERGTGKSRLLLELSGRLRRGGVAVAASACPVYVDTAVETLRELAAGLGVSFEDPLPPVMAFESAIKRAVSTNGSIALVVDDVDRAGPTTLEALQGVSTIDGVMLVASAGDAVVAGSAPWGDPLTVGALEPDELTELAVNRLGDLVGDRGEAATSTLEWLLDMSGGNPAFLEHLVEDPRQLAGHPRADGDESAAMAGSRGLADVVRSRLDRLGASTRAALEVAAVCGVRVQCTVLAQLATEDGIAGALAASLLTRAGGVDGIDSLAFRHGAVRKILYEELAPGRRMEIHYRAAEVMRASGVPISVVASHSLASLQLDSARAVQDALAAAEAAAAHGAQADAVEWYRRAVDAAEVAACDEALRVAALIGYGDSLRRAGSPEQEEALFAAADAAFDLGYEELIARAAFAVLQLGATTESGHLHLRAVELVDRAMAEVVEPDHRALIAGGASLAHSMSDDSVRCRELFLEAESLATSPVVRCEVLPFAYLGLGHPSDLPLREELTDELLALSAAADDPVARFEALQLEFSVGLQRCDGASVRSAVAESVGLIPKVGDVARRWSLAYQMAAVAHLDGDLDLAEARSEEALATFGDVSPSRAFATYGSQLLVIRMAQDRVRELAGTIEGLLADQPGVPAWNAALALAVAGDEPDTAHIHAEAALEAVAEDFTWLAAHVIGGRAAAQVGDEALCQRYIGRLDPYTTLGCWQGTCSYGPVDSVLWQLYRAAGDDESARHHLVLARDSAERLQAPVFAVELVEDD